MVNQAIGVPTGNHGLFNRYTIDSVTLSEIHSDGSKTINVHQLARIVEGTVRSVNNLLEHLHQSFYYYLLPSPTLYISIGEYMISFGLVTFGYVVRSSLSVLSLPYEGHVTQSLLIAATFEIMGFVLFSIPSIILGISSKYSLQISWEEVMTMWTAISALLVLFVYLVIVPIIERMFKLKTVDRESRANAFKTLLSVAPIVFLAASSLQNFSFAFFAAVLFVPMYATIFPRNRALDSLQRVILLVLSPPVVLQGLSVVMERDVFGILASIVQQYQMYSSLFFPFLCLVYIPTHCALFKLLGIV